MTPLDVTAVPDLSVVIPVYNGTEFLKACLESVYASDFASFEVIVVDDGSTDGSTAVARQFSCTVIDLPSRGGPAAARNAGASAARGAIYFFLDADILVERDTLSKIAREMAGDERMSALFGSYRKATVPDNFCSRYKNLLHHYTHQHSREKASTFCSGFGAIRREAFQRLGGFNPEKLFLEDIELGYRMAAEGMQVRLCKELQLTHCKRYTLSNLIHSDVRGRAIPWTRLMLDHGIFQNDLNTRWNNVLSVLVAFLLLLVPAFPVAPIAALTLLTIFVALNAGFLALTFTEGGLLFAAASCLMCWFGYIYSGVGMAAAILLHILSGSNADSRSPADIKET